MINASNRIYSEKRNKKLFKGNGYFQQQPNALNKYNKKFDFRLFKTQWYTDKSEDYKKSSDFQTTNPNEIT